MQASNTSCFTALDLSTIFRLISSVAVYTLRLIYCHALCYRTHAAAAAALEYTNTYLWCAHHFISFWCFIMAQLVNFNGIRRKLYAYILLQLFIREFRAIKMWQIRYTHIRAMVARTILTSNFACNNKILNQKNISIKAIITHNESHSH